MCGRSSVARLLVFALAAVVLVNVSPAQEVRSYPLRGILRSVDTKTGQATVSHEAVQGYMPAMTMDFDLADPAEVSALRSGDTFTCRWRATAPGWIRFTRKTCRQPRAWAR